MGIIYFMERHYKKRKLYEFLFGEYPLRSWVGIENSWIIIAISV